MFEGTGKYFLLLFLIWFVTYMTKKISLYFLFKNAKEKPYKALIPIVTTKTLIELLDMKKSIFYLCLIPGVNIFYYYQINKQLLIGFGQDEKETILYTLIPMYKFPKLVFKNPKFILNEYDLTNAFMETQNALFEKPKEELPDKINLVNLSNKVDEYHGTKSDDIIINPVKYEQIPDMNENTNEDNTLWNTQNKKIEKEADDAGYDSVFINQNVEPEKRQEKVVIAQKKEEVQKNPIDPYDSGRPKMCPNCGAKLSTDATTCFLCGTKL